MPLKDPVARRKYDRERPHRYNKETQKTYEQLASTRIARRNAREVLKKEVLAHYSFNPIPRCVWPECDIVDLDMLTLDHVNGGGTEHRRAGGCNFGVILYRKLRRAGYPVGYQTLCFNHQWKKQLTLLKQDFDSRNDLHAMGPRVPTVSPGVKKA
jgi:hypothetical protein